MGDGCITSVLSVFGGYPSFFFSFLFFSFSLSSSTSRRLCVVCGCSLSRSKRQSNVLYHDENGKKKYTQDVAELFASLPHRNDTCTRAQDPRYASSLCRFAKPSAHAVISFWVKKKEPIVKRNTDRKYLRKLVIFQVLSYSLPPTEKLINKTIK